MIEKMDSRNSTYDLISDGCSYPLYDNKDKDEYYDLIGIIKNRNIFSIYQPIVDLQTGEVYSYEALSRINGPSIFSGPDKLFQAAQRFHLTPDLEKICRFKALKRAQELNIEKLISLNICPSLLQPSDHKPAAEDLFEELFDLRENIILELTEKFYIADNRLFRETIDHFKRHGFKIAVDDLGSGFTGLKMLAELEPFIVKIDRFLINDIHKSTRKRMLLESIVSFCHKINSQVVAEGIETEKELETIISMKVDLA